jgi:citrate synthase
MFDDPDSKLNRPRQLFTGPAPRDFVPVEKRK